MNQFDISTTNHNYPYLIYRIRHIYISIVILSFLGHPIHSFLHVNPQPKNHEVADLSADGGQIGHMTCWQRVVFWANHVGIQPGAKGSVGMEVR